MNVLITLRRDAGLTTEFEEYDFNAPRTYPAPPN